MKRWICLLTITTFCIVLILGAAPVSRPKVAVYMPDDFPKKDVAEELLKAFAKDREVEVSMVGNLSETDLKPYKALIVWGTKYNPAAVTAKDVIGQTEADAIRKWVADGGGVLCLHIANGLARKNAESIFPEAAVGIDNAYSDRQPYSREAIVTREHPAAKELESGERFTVSYVDFITLEPGPKGVVLARQVSPTQSGGIVADPVVVAAEFGKGRVISCGFATGLHADGKAVAPAGAEKTLLLSSVRWLVSGVRQADSIESVSKGEILGPRNLMPNPSAELIKDGFPAGWRKSSSPGVETGISSDEKHGGKCSVYVKALDYSLHPDGKKKIFSGDLGPEEGLLVKPDTIYKLSFWMKTDAPYIVIGVSGSDRQNRFKALGNSLGWIRPEDDKWHYYEGTFTTSSDVNLVSLSIGLNGRSEPWGRNPAIKLGSVMYVDEFSVTEQGAADTVAEERAKVLEVMDKVEWKAASGILPMIESTPAGSPIKYSEQFQNATPYSALPSGWERIDLKGIWKLKVFGNAGTDQANWPGTAEGYWKKDFNDAEWPDQPVPLKWYVNDRYQLKADKSLFIDRPLPWVGWYRTKFNLPARKAGERALLKFEGVSHRCEIWLNGQRVGAHVGGYMGFSMDATEQAVYGGENRLAVRVFDSRPYHSQMFGVGGIWGRTYVDIAPETYARRLLITPDLGKNTLNVDAWLISQKEQSTIVEAELISFSGAFSKGPDYRKSQTLGEVKLIPGVNKMNFTVKMENPVLWSPANPFLYILELKSGKTVLGKTRFGFRSFTANGPDLMLNGKPVFLRGLKFAYEAHYYRQDILDPTEKGFSFMKRYLETRRQLNVNNLYTMASPLPPAVYDLCDELGLTVYADAPNPRKNLPNELTGTEDLRETDEWVYDVYNHPSQIMWSLGAELYGTDSKLLVPLYDKIHELDKQKRPVCASSGCRGEHESTDLWDFHAYPGGLADSWTAEDYFINDNKAVMMVRFAGRQMPVIQFEVGGTDRNYNGDDSLCKKAGFKVDNDWDKEKFIKIVHSGTPWRAGLTWMSTAYNYRLFLAGIERGERPGVSYQKTMINGLLGMARSNGFLSGIGPNQLPFDLVETPIDGKLSPARSFWQARRMQEPLEERELVAGEAFDDFKRVYSPALITMPLFPRNNIAGKPFSASFYVVNNTGETMKGLNVRAVFKSTDGTVFSDMSVELGELADYKRLRAPLSIGLPADLKTGEYRAELFLYEKGSYVSHAYCDFWVFAADSFAKSIVTGKKVALFDIGEKTLGPDAITTARILDILKVPHQRINNFDNMEQFNVLIIGAGSNGKELSEHGTQIAAWLEKGGRLLSFEQSLPGTMPYLPQINVVRGRPNIGTEIITLSHPAFTGLRPNDFFRWNGDSPSVGTNCPGAIFSCGLKPLNRTMVAVGGMDVPRNTLDALAMTLSDIRLGKGVAVLSQLEATCRYGSDGAATKYVQNLLNYIFSDETSYSMALDGFSIRKPDPNRCGLVQLGGENIRKTVQDVPLDLPDLAVEIIAGKTIQLPILSNVFFDPAFEAEYEKSHVDEGGLAHNQAERIYILHGGADGSPGETIGSYRLQFTDGTSSALQIVAGVNIGGSEEAKDLPQALAIGNGRFLTVWVNPKPGVAIKSLETDTRKGKTFKIYGITCELIRGRTHQ